jgi:hypothetical protein
VEGKGHPDLHLLSGYLLKGKGFDPFDPKNFEYVNYSYSFCKKPPKVVFDAFAPG